MRSVHAFLTTEAGVLLFLFVVVDEKSLFTLLWRFLDRFLKLTIWWRIFPLPIYNIEMEYMARDSLLKVGLSNLILRLVHFHFLPPILGIARSTSPKMERLKCINPLIDRMNELRKGCCLVHPLLSYLSIPPWNWRCWALFLLPLLLNPPLVWRPFSDFDATAAAEGLLKDKLLWWWGP